MGAQAPSTLPPVRAAVHDWHPPVQEVLQHTPSTHLPVRHWVLPVQGDPWARRQAPEPLQTLLPTQVGESCWPVGVLTQVPTLPETPHDWHDPVQAVLQQTPSTQLPLAHWLPSAQAMPSPSRQLPVPLHTFDPRQLGVSCWKAGVLTQEPTLPATLHDWQTPLQGPLQQTPSTQ